jgi:hypothetical protein
MKQITKKRASAACRNGKQLVAKDDRMGQKEIIVNLLKQ